MTLILQVLCVLVAGAVLTRVLTARSPTSMGVPIASVGLVVALLAGVLFFYHAYKTGSGLPELTQTASEVSSFEAQNAAESRANNKFLTWARDEMLANPAHRRDTYYLEPAAVLPASELGQWSSYELLPERATSKLSEADWIVFYGVEPTLTAEQLQQFGAITEFSPGYALASRSSGH